MESKPLQTITLFFSCTSFQCSFVAGVINRERMASFERLLWIASRGKVFMKWAEIEEEIENLATVRY